MELYKILDEKSFRSFRSDSLCVFTSYIKDSKSTNTYDDFLYMFIKSLALSNKNENINVFIIINDKVKTSLDFVFNLNKNIIVDSKLTFYIIDNRIFEHYMNNVSIDKGFSNAIVYRLFVPFLLTHIDKFVWLDLDMIVCSSIKKLFDFSINDYSFIGYKDINDIEVPFLNSGVTLINSSRIRDRYKSLNDLLRFYIENDCVTDQIFIFKDNDYLTLQDITNNYPGLYSRCVHSFINNPVIVNKLSDLAKNAKVVHFYPKDEYKKSHKLIDILKENNDIVKNCLIDLWKN